MGIWERLFGSPKIDFAKIPTDEVEADLISGDVTKKREQYAKGILDELVDLAETPIKRERLAEFCSKVGILGHTLYRDGKDYKCNDEFLRLLSLAAESMTYPVGLIEGCLPTNDLGYRPGQAMNEYRKDEKIRKEMLTSKKSILKIEVFIDKSLKQLKNKIRENLKDGKINIQEAQQILKYMKNMVQNKREFIRILKETHNKFANILEERRPRFRGRRVDKTPLERFEI